MLMIRSATDSATSVPALGQQAPPFEGRSTHGLVKLCDYAGKWLVFFSHPADFTPVCTSEFTSFARHHAAFAALNCELLGLSVDSVFSHLAWRESIREHFGVTIDFPILEDISMQIAHRYGMLQSSADQTSALRALFIIDPLGVVRAVLQYPAATGRSVAEVLRLLQALQTVDRLHVVTPEGWIPGQATVEPPPQTVKETDERRELNVGCVDWYYYATPTNQRSAV